VSEQRPPDTEALERFEDFLLRHVGTSDEEQAGMLKALGYESLDALIDAAVPDSVRSLAKARRGTRRIRRTNPRSARGASRPCSISRPWCRT